MPPISLETLVGIFKHVGYPLPSPDGTPATTLHDMRKVCKRWNAVIVRHPSLFPRIPMELLDITVIRQGTRYTPGRMSGWTNYLTCKCYAKTKEKAKQLVGQRIFPNVGPFARISIKADGVEFLVCNQLRVKDAEDLCHMSSHLRNVYFRWLCIRAFIDADLTLNPLLTKVLHPIHSEKPAFRLKTLLQLRDSLLSDFIKIRQIICAHDFTTVSNLQVTELLDFISRGRDTATEELTLCLEGMLDDASKITIVDTIFKHFATTCKNLNKAINTVNFFELGAGWPTSLLIQEHENAALFDICTFMLTNVHSGQQFEVKLRTSGGPFQVIDVRLIFD